MRMLLLLTIALAAGPLVAQVQELSPPIAKFTRPEKVTEVFDTPDSFKACLSARMSGVASGRYGAKTADEVCDAGIVVKLAPGTHVEVRKIGPNGGTSFVAVVSGKNAAKEGWVLSADLRAPDVP